MIIFHSPLFQDRLEKLNGSDARLFKENERIFSKNPHAALLKTRPLVGGLNWFWTFSAGHWCHVIFEFGKNGDVYFHWIGRYDLL